MTFSRFGLALKHLHSGTEAYYEELAWSGKHLGRAKVSFRAWPSRKADFNTTQGDCSDTPQLSGLSERISIRMAVSVRPVHIDGMAPIYEAIHLDAWHWFIGAVDEMLREPPYITCMRA